MVMGPAGVIGLAQHDDSAELTRALRLELRPWRSVARLIDGLVSPTLADVGRHWHQGQISAAEEHRLTALIESACVTLLAELQMSRRSPRSSGRLLVACAPNEQHVIAARLGSEVLRSEGWRVRFVGGDMPLQTLEAYLLDFKPELLLLSASSIVHTLQLAFVIERASSIGCPTALCGSPWSNSVSHRLGAAVSFRSMTEALATLTAWEANGWPAAKPAATDGSLHDDLDSLARQGSAIPIVDIGEPDVRSAMERIPDVCAAARLLNEPAHAREHGLWLRDLVLARDADIDAVVAHVIECTRQAPVLSGSAQVIAHALTEPVRNIDGSS